MSTIEKARELANAIKTDPILVAYQAARAAYDASTELQTKMTEYNAQRAILGQEFSKEAEAQSPELLEMVRNRMDELAREISAMEEYREFSAAQLKVTDLMNQVNAEIQRIVFGVEPSAACTHDCSTCHAACGEKH
ncbi:MAG: YlbF family regulator [Eubacteriales bacterium]